MATYGLILNTKKENAASAARRVINKFKEMKEPFLLEEKAAELLDMKDKSANFSQMRKEADIILLFGGDGTLLHTAHHFQGTEIPLLGVNLGSLGFMTEIELEKLDRALQSLLKGNYEIEERMMLEVKVQREGNEVFHSHALNDVVINRGANAHLINIELHVRSEFIHSYRGDGLIVSTPTGSTAYSLSAGGPIINPQIRAILITPICPHSLSIRPMVISEKEKIEIFVSGDQTGMRIASDGRYSYSLENNDKINITASEKSVSLVKLPGSTFYSILREKME